MARGPEPEPGYSESPTIAVSMGDPGGIGPEIVVKALAERRQRWPGARFVVLGSSAAMHRAAEIAGVEPGWVRVARSSAIDPTLAEIAAHHGVAIIDSDPDLHARGIEPAFEHRPNRLGGELSHRWVEDAISLAQRPEGDPLRADAIVTAPISKAAWHMAGKTRHPGHTELFAERFRVKRYAMLFSGPRLCVALATIHVPLMDVRHVLTIGSVHTAIDLGAKGLQRLGVARPRIAVCGLNPHAGEGGLLGDEETRLIEPAINLAVETGLDVRGPFPGDTVFNRAVAGEFDLVVAMYHDQGLIPVKLLARDESINITVGLPTIRTSPDHGTAFDIAGGGGGGGGGGVRGRRGRADASSMIAAIDGAVRMLEPRGVGEQSST